MFNSKKVNEKKHFKKVVANIMIYVEKCSLA